VTEYGYEYDIDALDTRFKTRTTVESGKIVRSSVYQVVHTQVNFADVRALLVNKHVHTLELVGAADAIYIGPRAPKQLVAALFMLCPNLR
jgi:hypothetical protein